MKFTESKIAGAIEKACPELQIFLRSRSGTRFLVLSSKKQFAALAFAFVFAIWSVVATASLLISGVWDGSADIRVAVLSDAYESRLANLATELDQAETGSLSVRRQLDAALVSLARQQTEILGEMQERQRLATSLDILRNKLEDAVTSRNQARSENEDLTARLETMVSDLGSGHSGQQDLTETLETMSAALADAARNRDTAYASIAALEISLEDVEVQMKVNAERQNVMFTRLEDAVGMSFEPLNKMFERAGVDIDSIMSHVRRDYSGTGGPLIPAAISTKLGPATDPTAGDERQSAARYNDLMRNLGNLNLMQIAAAKVPFAKPVHERYRYTSGFGFRHDPKTGTRRLHKGTDFAAPRGTPILATADGEVIFAGVQRGYGRFVKVRHGFGFESAYAHLSAIDVKVGQKVSRGDQIGKMGSTGRSTGTHLHYEVRLGGKQVNPMKYLKAAENVY